MLTLGINYSGMHDSSACIVRDGELLFAVAEERLSRIKHDSRFPYLSIQACLQFAGVKPEQVDEVCFGWSPPWMAMAHEAKCFLTGRYQPSYHYVVSAATYGFWMMRRRGGMREYERAFGVKGTRMRYVHHHLAHALSAYAYSGLKEATVVVMDGRGAWEATSIWYGHDGMLDHVETIPWPNSLGLFYAEFTHYLGFQRYSDEWKVMGLAPYGEPGVNLRSLIVPDGTPYWVNARRLLGRSPEDLSAIESLLGPRRMPESEIEERHKNIAYAVQQACEEAMISVVRMAVEKTGCRNLCLAGGVALNSKANGKLLTSGLVDKIFIQPAASDEGVALGAALAPYLDNGGRLPTNKMRHVYLGLSYSDEQIESLLRTYKLRFTRLEDPAEVGAEMLAQGKIIGWFQGRMEFGPRALGSRSILADPRNPTMKDKVNKAVKFREWWRPFAPSLLAEVADEFLESATDSPFMILTAQMKPEKRGVIPAVTHVDGSTRPQTVERSLNPTYWNLINEFGKRTGVPVVMNTSFNLRGEPIVNTPTDAIRTFFSSGMDALLIGSFLVEK